MTAFALLGAPAVGEAAPTPADSPRAPAPRAESVVASPAERSTTREIREYWTAARMAAARPLDLPAVSDADTSAEGDATATPDASGRSRVRVPKTAGKLFFTTSRGNSVCSAAVIKTKRRNNILTAGHCVHSGGYDGAPREWYTNFAFVPRYHNGKRPHGTWVYKKVWAFRQWTQSTRFGYDQAIIKLQKRNHRKIVDVTGGNRLKAGANQRQRGVRIWGWPAEAPYDGETAHRCDGKTTKWPGARDARMRCPMNGGASGGPWLLKKRRKANTGIIWAVTSRRTEGPGYLLARPLPKEIWKMVRVAN